MANIQEVAVIVFEDVRTVRDKLLNAMRKTEGANLDLGETLLLFRLLTDFILPLEKETIR